jgi:CheY-like chemotaxis protein
LSDRDPVTGRERKKFWKDAPLGLWSYLAMTRAVDVSKPLLIVSQNAPQWWDRLKQVFGNDGGVDVMIDRRREERRRRPAVIMHDRRRRTRRQHDLSRELEQKGWAFAAPEEWPEHRAGKHILLVEDDPLVADALAQLLRCDGYRVDVVPNGLLAMAELAQRDYDVIVCDVSLPELDGPGLYRGVAAIAPHLLPRFIFITAHDVMAGDETLAQVAAPLIHKPFEIDVLHRAIRRVS